MRMDFPDQRSRGLTRPEVLVAVLLAIFLLTILFGMVMPPRRESRITCIANLREISTALRVWENDNAPGMPPLKNSEPTNGLNSGQIAWINATGISNIVHSSKILICPADRETPTTTDAAGNKIRISYFLNSDANEGYPQEILSGDDNLAAKGIPVKPGIFELSSNTPIAWTLARHRYGGNISLADGSVEQTTSSSLENAAVYSLNGTPLFTNRFAIP